MLNSAHCQLWVRRSLSPEGPNIISAAFKYPIHFFCSERCKSSFQSSSPSSRDRVTYEQTPVIRNGTPMDLAELAQRFLQLHRVLGD